MLRGRVTCRELLLAYASGVREFDGVALVDPREAQESDTLAGSSLVDARFVSAKLRGAELARADLSGAQFVDSDLHGVNLSGACLVGCRITRCLLTHANLERANLFRVVVDRADFGHANLQFANLDDTFLYAIDLEEAKLADVSAKQAFVYLLPMDDNPEISQRLVSAGARVRTTPGVQSRPSARGRRAAFLGGMPLSKIMSSSEQLERVADLETFTATGNHIVENAEPAGKPLKLVFDPSTVAPSKVAAAIGVLEELFGGELRISRVGSLPPKAGATPGKELNGSIERSEP